MSAALSDMEVSEGAALFRPTKTATFFGSGLSGLARIFHAKTTNRVGTAFQQGQSNAPLALPLPPISSPRNRDRLDALSGFWQQAHHHHPRSPFRTTDQSPRVHCLRLCPRLSFGIIQDGLFFDMLCIWGAPRFFRSE